MRAVAESMAEALAPGLSNRTMDGRWLSIMCWALQQAYAAWRVYGATENGGFVEPREAAREIYSWLRPLELLWVARTVMMTGEDRGRGRQLPGVRAINRWVDGDSKGERFAFEPSAYSRYRFTGVYGAYRVALRSLPGLTARGDGWRLGPLGTQLAELVNNKVQCSQPRNRGKGRKPDPERYWKDKFEWDSGQEKFLPTVLAEPKRLTDPEREYLKRALFSSKEGTEVDCRNGMRRRAVVEAAARSSAITRHGLLADIARAVGRDKALREIALLSPFCELADAGVEAMNACWTAVSKGDGIGFARATDVLARTEVAHALDALKTAAERWQRDSGKGDRQVVVADAFAASMIKAGNNRMAQFQALERHHNQFGGGLKWLALDGDMVKPLARTRGVDGSKYQFRIGPLCRLGVQAGIVGSMPAPLHNSDELSHEEDD